VATTLHPCDATVSAAHATVERLLDERPDLTAVVVHNEPIIEPVVHAFQQAGRQLPADLSIVAICPDAQAEHALIPLTSVSIPAEEVGQHAVELLMAKLDGQDVPDATLLPPTLTARASTAARSPAT
jgi:DNA-binding LacI/PurR family transcriptional regulator